MAVHAGAVLDLHGAKVVSWTRLAQAALVGSSTIQVVGPVDWVAGDRIVITSTNTLGGTDEVGVIASINRMIYLCYLLGLVFTALNRKYNPIGKCIGVQSRERAT